jgi:hypothetical protein
MAGAVALTLTRTIGVLLEGAFLNHMPRQEKASNSPDGDGGR